jgi:hypothetical protein
MAPIILLANVIVPLALPSLAFAPVMIISIYCAVGNVAIWYQSYRLHALIASPHVGDLWALQ